MDALYEHDFSQLEFPFLTAIDRGQSPFLYHWHDEVELVYILRGSVDAGIHNRVYHLRPGDILLIGSGETHCFFTVDDDAERLAVKFSPRLALPLAPESLESQRMLTAVSRVCKCSREWPEMCRHKVREIITSLYTEASGRVRGYQAAIRALIYQLMLVILRELPEETGGEAVRQTGQDTSFKRTLLFLAENYTSDISLKDCAQAMGFNMNYFSRFFRVHTGINFHEYLIRLRLKKAEWLLLNTSLSITDIVYQSGFQNVKTFNRVFKKAHDCSPREFRRQKAAS